MTNYYFLAASLPPLTFGQKPEITFAELKERLAQNLSQEDRKKAELFLRFIDLQNIRSLLQEEPIDMRGNLDEKELDEALLVRNILPEYVFDFLGQFDNLADQLHNFHGLLAHFFQEEAKEQKGFVKAYLQFEKEWRLVLLALRAKDLGKDLVKELQFEDFSDPLVMHMLAQKDATTYEPPEEWQELKELMRTTQLDPWQRYKAFAAWRFHKIEEMVGEPLFSIDWILAYMVQLILIEDWFHLDETKGKMILETIKTG